MNRLRLQDGVHFDSCYALIVDDDRDFLLLLTRAFERAGIPRSQVRALENGEQAIHWLEAVALGDAPHESAPPSLILLDHHLPGKSGLDVLDWIRRTPALQEVPVFMLTSSPAPEHVDQAFTLGANSYFVKPLNFDELLATIQGILAYWESHWKRRRPDRLRRGGDGKLRSTGASRSFESHP